MSRIPDYLPGGGAIELDKADPNTGKASLILPGGARADRESSMCWRSR